MAVYFIHQLSAGEPLLKIGRAKDIYRRRDELQTGNPHTLVLVGWILSDTESTLEADLHRKYRARRAAGEWFRLEPGEILDDLKHAGSRGFVARQADAFAIVGHDRDAVPEYLGVWDWSDLELGECCPFCGSMCGMHFQDASQAYHCMSCGRLTDFSENAPEVDSEEDYRAWLTSNPSPPPMGMDRFVILGGTPEYPEHLRRNRRLR
jgi:hypothetical protein